jgi:hypothetical protein
MQLTTFNALPVKIQDFILATEVPISYVFTNHLKDCPTPRVFFTGKGNGKISQRFSAYDAQRIKKWWNG